MRKLSPLPKVTRDALYDLMPRVGVHRLCVVAGLSRHALLNALCGHPVLQGTKALIANAIRDLTAELNDVSAA